MSKQQEFNFLDEKLRDGSIWDILYNKKSKTGIGKEVYVFDYYVLKFDKKEKNQDNSQLINEIYRWRTFPTYIKKYLAPIKTYGINYISLNEKNKNLRKTRKYNNFEDNFLLMEKLDTRFKTIKNFCFKNEIKIKTMQNIDSELIHFVDCVYDNIKYSNPVLEPMRKSFSKFVKESDDTEWIDDIIFNNIGYNEKKGIIQLIDYGL